MLHRVTALRGQRIETGGETHDVNEIWFDDESWRIRYLGVDVGGWFNSRTAVVKASRLTAGPGADGDWHVELTRDELEAAPVSEERDGQHIFDIAALPPVLTGPFGNTVSPMLIHAGLLAEAEDEMPPRNPDEAPDRPLEAPALREIRRLECMGDWIGAPVFSPDGEIGPLSDMLFEPSAQSISALVAMMPDGPRAIPLGQLRRRAANGGHLVMVPEADRIASSPAIPAAPDAEWLKALRGHYAG